MAERSRSKAGATVEHLMSLEEPTRFKLPALRLRPDVPRVAVDESAPIKDAVRQLEDRDVTAIALTESGPDAAAVVVSAERYLELIGKELVVQRTGLVMNSHGQLVPPESDFARAHVQQLHPKDEAWSWNERNS